MTSIGQDRTGIPKALSGSTSVKPSIWPLYRHPRELLSRRQRHTGHGSPAARCRQIDHHDLQQGRIISPGHDKAGEPLAESFLKRIGFPFTKEGPSPLTEKILKLVECHMRHLNIPSRKSALRLARDVYPASIDMLVS